jgi:hypothetical protein
MLILRINFIIWIAVGFNQRFKDFGKNGFSQNEYLFG